MRRLALFLILFLIAALLTIGAALHPSQGRLEQLARSGIIQENASIKTTQQITVNASPEKVWALLAGIDHWPSWQHDITKSQIGGPLQAGAPFSWSTGGMDIDSRVALVDPNRELAWTGKASIAKAIHVWKLQRLPDGQTLVTTTESMDGVLLSLFFSSKQLAESDRRWLSDLKLAAER